jgi:hypothetical protein
MSAKSAANASAPGPDTLPGLPGKLSIFRVGTYNRNLWTRGEKSYSA